MTNFDFLQSDSRFDSFSEVAISAEQLLHIDVAASVLNCRRAMEFAVKWMYEWDRDLQEPHDATLLTMMEDKAFQQMVGKKLFRKMELIRKWGNTAAHEDEEISLQQGIVCLENLFDFLNFVAVQYSKHYRKQIFDSKLLELTAEEALSFVAEQERLP